MITGIKQGILIFLFTVLSLISLAGSTDRLQYADSLFKAQKYTEAYTFYEELFENDQISSSMLLKMSFIQDASGNYSNALFYLDLYYRKTGDRQSVGKIKELASTFDLNGYQYNDIDYFLALLSKFRIPIVLLLLSFSVLLSAYVYVKFRQGIRAYFPFIFQVFTFLILLGVVNYQVPDKAIVVMDQTLLRRGPSAGAEPIELINQGHKVTVLNTSKIWTKILWNGEEVFIRNNRLKSI